MIWGTIIQIAGVISVAIGSILALSKLWSNYFERSKSMADFLSSIIDKKNGKNNKTYPKKLDEEKTPNSDLIKKLVNFIVEEKMLSIEGQLKIRMLIFRLSSRENLFLTTGIGLIVLGSFLQVVGLILS